ncbi:MAG: hypothetical protein WAN34_13935 [Acidimicrobiia bacterium]
MRIQRTNGEPDAVGVTVSEGPLTYRVLVTDPYRQQGRILEIPHEEIECIERIDDSDE